MPEAGLPEARLQVLLGWGLRIGTLLVALGMGVALAWSLVTGVFPQMDGTLRRHLDVTGLVWSTALLLVLLPPARVIAAMIAFAAEKNWRYVAFSALALVLLAASTVLGVSLRKG